MHEAQSGALRRSHNRIVAGVCAGLADYLQVDPVIIRLIFVVLTFVPPIGPLTVLAYGVLWLLMPPAEAAGAPAGGMGAGLRSVGDDFRRMGEEFRKAFSRSGGAPAPAPGTTGPPAAPTEPPPPGEPRHRAAIVLGGLLVLTGLVALLRNLGLLDWLGWDVFWPLLLVALGVAIVVQRLRSHA